MPGIGRKSIDVAGGVLVQGSPNVFANNKPVTRIGDLVAGHGKSPHAAPVMAVGSNDVLTNFIPTCREGDPATCGHPTSGSNDVFVN